MALVLPHLTLITTCSKKKLATPFAQLKPAQKFETQDALQEYWEKLLGECPDKRKVRANELYRGRGYQRISRLAEVEDIRILSAGLGLVSATDMLVPYNLTTSSGSPNHVKNHIVGPFNSQLWWENLSGQRLQMAIEAADGLVLIALSRAYMEMIAPELAILNEEAKAKVRLFGTDLEEAIDFSWFDNIMPYDNRLALSPIFAGSKIDFSARALQHFVQQVLPVYPNGDTSVHAKAVHEYISTLGTIEQANKETADDTRIREIVDTEWEAAFGRFTRLLQTIRSKYQIACSENRLKRILKEREEEAEEGGGEIDEIDAA